MRTARAILSNALVLIILLGITACDKNDSSNINPLKIQGHWEWIVSGGGFAGEQITPSTLNATQSLRIGKQYFRHYVNDELLYGSNYEIVNRTDAYGRTDTYLELEKGDAWLVQLDGHELILQDPCFDCYVHIYERD